jgi:hypothetical protein
VNSLGGQLFGSDKRFDNITNAGFRVADSQKGATKLNRLFPRPPDLRKKKKRAVLPGTTSLIPSKPTVEEPKRIHGAIYSAFLLFSTKL